MIIRFTNTDTSAVRTLQSIADTVKLGGGEFELGGNTENNEEIPIMRHANSRNGVAIFEPNDGSSYTATLAEILALHSGTGEGKYTIALDGTNYAYKAIVDVSMIGSLGQLIQISWKGADSDGS